MDRQSGLFHGPLSLRTVERSAHSRNYTSRSHGGNQVLCHAEPFKAEGVGSMD
nr:unnamed protein product [Callosobruchus chinensis]